MQVLNYGSLPSCFVTATDTDAGKTYVSCEILKSWQQQGWSVGAFKPIASGAIWQNGKLISEDAQALAEVTGQSVDEINPFTFEQPASPHIADSHHEFELKSCLKHFELMLEKYDRILVEGVGGWCVPLSEELMLKDVVMAMNLPVVMVARIGLGCINHSLLTIEQIKRDTSLYHGWVANIIDQNYVDAEKNIQSINHRT